MVIHHWSNNGMVTYHRWSLPKTQTLRRTDSLFRKIKKMRQGSPSSSFTAALRSRGIKIWWLFFDICGIFGRPMVSSKFTNPPSSLCSNLDFWDKTSFLKTKLLIGLTGINMKIFCVSNILPNLSEHIYPVRAVGATVSVSAFRRKLWILPHFTLDPHRPIPLESVLSYRAVCWRIHLETKWYFDTIHPFTEKLQPKYVACTWSWSLLERSLSLNSKVMLTQSMSHSQNLGDP